MHSLQQKTCKPGPDGVTALSPGQIEQLMAQIPGWSLEQADTAIQRRFKFPSFSDTMKFVNALAGIAATQDHHPDFTAGYNYCTVSYSTHSIGALSENDFICAAQINQVLLNNKGN